MVSDKANTQTTVVPGLIANKTDLGIRFVITLNTLVLPGAINPGSSLSALIKTSSQGPSQKYIQFLIIIPLLFKRVQQRVIGNGCKDVVFNNASDGVGISLKNFGSIDHRNLWLTIYNRFAKECLGKFKSSISVLCVVNIFSTSLRSDLTAPSADESRTAAPWRFYKFLCNRSKTLLLYS